METEFDSWRRKVLDNSMKNSLLRLMEPGLEVITLNWATICLYLAALRKGPIALRAGKSSVLVTDERPNNEHCAMKPRFYDSSKTCHASHTLQVWICGYEFIRFSDKTPAADGTYSLHWKIYEQNRFDYHRDFYHGHFPWTPFDSLIFDTVSVQFSKLIAKSSANCNDKDESFYYSMQLFLKSRGFLTCSPHKMCCSRKIVQF